MYMMTPRQEQVWAPRITLAILTCLAGYLSFLVLHPFMEPLAYGVIAAVLSYPLYQRLAGRIRYPGWAAFLTSAIVVIAFVGPMVFLGSIGVRELRNAFQSLDPQALQSWDRPLNAVAGWLGMDSEALRQAITERMGSVGPEVVRRVIALLGATGGGIMNGIVALMTLFFALRNGSTFFQQVLSHSPLGTHRTFRMAEAARAMFVASFYGVVAVAAAQGILCGLGAWIAGLPSPPLWGLAGFAASVIPVFGSSLVWLPAAITLFVQGSIGYGIFMLIWGALVISQVDTLVRPWVLMTQVPMNGLVIFITLLGGIQAFGLIGIFIGPVVLAVTLELFQIVREEFAHETPDLRLP